MTTNHPGKVSYTTAENNLTTDVSELPEYESKNKGMIAARKGDGDQEIA